MSPDDIPGGSRHRWCLPQGDGSSCHGLWVFHFLSPPRAKAEAVPAYPGRAAGRCSSWRGCIACQECVRNSARRTVCKLLLLQQVRQPYWLAGLRAVGRCLLHPRELYKVTFSLSRSAPWAPSCWSSLAKSRLGRAADHDDAWHGTRAWKCLVRVEACQYHVGHPWIKARSRSTEELCRVRLMRKRLPCSGQCHRHHATQAINDIGRPSRPARSKPTSVAGTGPGASRVPTSLVIEFAEQLACSHVHVEQALIAAPARTKAHS